jgi:hypothetical protein
MRAKHCYTRQHGKTVSALEKEFCMSEFHETKSAVTVEQQFQQKHRYSSHANHQFMLCMSVLLTAVYVRVKVTADHL